MNFGKNHAPGEGSIAQPTDLQSNALPLSYGCPHTNEMNRRCTMTSLYRHIQRHHFLLVIKFSGITTQRSKRHQHNNTATYKDNKGKQQHKPEIDSWLSSNRDLKAHLIQRHSTIWYLPSRYCFRINRCHWFFKTSYCSQFAVLC